MTTANFSNENNDLIAMPFGELESFMASINEKRFRAGQIFRAIHKQGLLNIDEVTSISLVLRKILQEKTTNLAITIDKVFISTDGTRKYQLKTHDGHIVESVFIPNASSKGRNTICISSQIGCAMGCTFCATAAMKLVRQLEPSEIVSQIYVVINDLKSSAWKNPQIDDSHEESKDARIIHNIVYMGMGEPLHNYENVKRSIELLCDQKGLGYAAKRITVSSCGVVKNIERLGKETDVHIAISLNATKDEVRNKIMPVNKKWDIAALLKACKNFPIKTRRRITFEYVLLKDINDSNEDANKLVELLKSFKCKINLIPFNEHPLSPFKRPVQNRVLEFQNILIKSNLSVFIRSTRGDDVDAACGMLGAKKLEDARENI
ncbi:23S rRNA (adenine(2503)-C(2))-methyltransferase RlmN [Sulfobacillus acidophilus]|uniref:Probable dual-specificity RNA methyltransferase RlmN n=1 Tax=Sulfobacillus acidophilus TaxID=53633 RepID=A0ABS3AWE5_9FIRM|nr:23S rRNA (adenine(2503)-C(2))-methyltransferase RlmN [Sulfobacillus acidophilus]